MLKGSKRLRVSGHPAVCNQEENLSSRFHRLFDVLTRDWVWGSFVIRIMSPSGTIWDSPLPRGRLQQTGRGHLSSTDLPTVALKSPAKELRRLFRRFSSSTRPRLRLRRAQGILGFYVKFCFSVKAVKTAAWRKMKRWEREMSVNLRLFFSLVINVWNNDFY